MSDSPLAQMLGRIPSGVFILTCRHGEQETGMLASWVMQAGFEPPMVTVAVNLKRYLVDWIDAGDAFALNVVPAGHKPLLAHFGRGFEPGQPAFDGLAIERTMSGLPTLVESLGWLECLPRAGLDSADHRIVLAEVIAASRRAEGDPMVHIRRNGLHY